MIQNVSSVNLAWQKSALNLFTHERPALVEVKAATDLSNTSNPQSYLTIRNIKDRVANMFVE